MSGPPKLPSEHAAQLEKAYRSVGEPTWSTADFLEANLAASRNLYTPESLFERRPRTKDLEVFALLAGLPFDGKFVDALVRAQQEISEVLGERLHYWVVPENLGLEYCVFKWPTGPWGDDWIRVIRSVVGSMREPSFRFDILGVQINPDGCVVAKGFDEDGVVFRIREQLKAQLPFFPAKQSGWAHVPLGRILEPLGAERFGKLARRMHTLADLPIATTEINSMKLVHEMRWYMEEKTVLAEFPLANAKSKL
jgi:hypothetical protein